MSLKDYASGVDLAQDIKDKKISPVEIMDETIDMIEKRNDSITAFTYTMFDEAREKAAEAEKKAMAGEADGAFFGVPTAAKDFQPSIPGWPGSYGGIKALSHLKDTRYSDYSKAMLGAGAIFVGKTNSPSLAFRGTCDNLMWGPTSTPFKPGYNSGGSSGGSASAVGDGMLLVAHATDAGGSIRIPAAWCGVYGFKPGIGTVGASSPRPDAFVLTHNYAWEGSCSRTVKDAAYVLQEMAVYNPFNPTSVDWGFKKDFIGALDRDIKGWKVAFTPDWGVFPVDSQVASIVEAAAKRFEEAGASVDRFDFGVKRSAFELGETWCKIITLEAMEGVEDFKSQGIDLFKDHAEDLPEEFIYWVNKAYQGTSMDFFHNQSIRTEVYDAMAAVFQDYDIIVSPTTSCLPVKNDPNRNTLGPSEINGVKSEPLIGFCQTFFSNFAGNPAASIPAGLSAEGLPVGMQIIGRRFHDEDVLTASAVFEQIQPWMDTYKITAERPL